MSTTTDCRRSTSTWTAESDVSHPQTLDVPEEGAAHTPSKALWASVAEGFYVGSHAGTFLGYVDRQPGGLWRAFDSASQIIGDFTDHHTAIAAVTEAMTDDTAAGGHLG